MKVAYARPRLRGMVGISVAVSIGVLACGGGGGAAGPGGLDAGADGGGAPVVAAPDLRFKWVGTGFTLKAAEFTNAGTGGPSQTGIHGQQFWSALNLTGEGSSDYFLFKTVENLETMTGVVISAPLAGMEKDLDGLRDRRGITTSLDSGDFGVDPPGYVYNALLIRTDSATVSYDPFVRGAVGPESIGPWAAQQGSQGNVVTALCPAARDADAGGGAGLVYLTAFGRVGDTATYETQVAISPYAALGAQLDAMAAGGYVVTALGRDGTGRDGAGNFVAVGTRVAGQTSPRAIKIVDVPCITGGGASTGTALEALLADGYALVGEIFHGAGQCDGTPSWALIGER